MKWRFFIGAAILIGYAMLDAGAPWTAVAAGIGIVALVNYWQQSRKSRRASDQRAQPQDRDSTSRRENGGTL